MLSITRVLQILLMRRFLIGVCVACCLVGVIVVSLIVPPIWQAHAQVVLNTVKPDPVTGEMSAGPGAGAVSYESTQMNLITSYPVIGRVVDTMGLQTDPDIIAQYQARSSEDHRDFRTFAADLIAKNVKVKPVKDSNILDISYQASSANAATTIANAILKAYIDVGLAFRTDSAKQTADFYEGELTKLKVKLDDALAAQAAYERANGLVMANDKIDVESERLQSLAGSGAPLVLPPPLADATKQSSLDLASVNGQIASASKTLGPNNPQMQELMRRKAGLETLVAQDRAAARAANSAAAAGVGNTDRQIASQKAKVLANSDKIGHLETLQQDVDQRRADYQTAALKFATFRAQADLKSSDTFSPLPAEIPDKPIFPKWLLEIPGAIILGLMIGGLTALLMELMNRRVRVVEDLDRELDVPLIGVIPAAASARASRAATRRARGLNPNAGTARA
jgi:succinoglycan biosynthesis transport protein ExoP